MLVLILIFNLKLLLVLLVIVCIIVRSGDVVRVGKNYNSEDWGIKMMLLI